MNANWKHSFIVVALASLVCVGCGGSSSDPERTMVINGTTIPVANATVWYWSTGRELCFSEQADRSGREVCFEEAVQSGASAKYVNGTWTAFDDVFTYVYVSDGSGYWYGSGSSYEGVLSVEGASGSEVDVHSRFKFTSGDADEIRVAYTGPYDYEED